ncbi:hypothetical protein NC796_00750 [Aliifodinibius sp. S!AR15-10]|uniref:hypothetical protein n=1 Tax=Aliifodinibius sp. S!AR15-10 TaxID=2950437 RepID=UPI0028651126|nr:hypothetical protein [Aliifodinibius sp. S!AR15-10]MDR8389643.1 hypothetical protein [Aliifodinibius sp. S!AR15-10]
MNEKNRRYYFAQGFVAQADEIFVAFPPPTVGIKPFKLESPVVGDTPLKNADLRHKWFLNASAALSVPAKFTLGRMVELGMKNYELGIVRDYVILPRLEAL